MCHGGGVEHHLMQASMPEVITIGLDIAKNIFHVHGADAEGQMVFSRWLTRAKLLDVFASQPTCLVAMEACGGAHHWARQLAQFGHSVRLIPPAYVKPFVTRQKSDAVDAEEQQASGMVFRTRDLMVRQRTQLINAPRGHLAEYGRGSPKGKARTGLLAGLLDKDKMARIDGDTRAIILFGRGQRIRKSRSPRPTRASPRSGSRILWVDVNTGGGFSSGRKRFVQAGCPECPKYP